ncbi:hypothetical protein [Arcobacter sp. LA11]|uniref:hypothetical protein n=1 Tax=Arcobacter sp. LA11 TaxID=1898176 RepID=UPI001160B357|nr:hypothetical protein [Arcobacter sp. LA11]
MTITLTILISLFDLTPSDPSLKVRFKHWYEYIKNFSFINIIFPSQIAYRQEMNYGTFHNEILEQFSYFGLLIYYYYYIIIKIFSNVKKEFEAYSFTILVVLFIASLLQSNLTNPFLSIVWVNVVLIFKEYNQREQFI